MARIRSVKPEFFSSVTVSRITPLARLTWIAMWCHADDEGRMDDDARLVRSFAWPFDDFATTEVVEGHLAELDEQGLIIRYVAEGRAYIAVTNFTEHQHPNRATKSTRPPPPNHRSEDSMSAHGAHTEGSPLEGRGEERKGGEATPPPSTCKRHPDGTDQPCQPCKSARLAHEAWTRSKAGPSVPVPGQLPRCPKHPEFPRDDVVPLGCDACRAERQEAA